MYTFHTNIISTCRTISNIPPDKSLEDNIETHEDSTGLPSSYQKTAAKPHRKHQKTAVQLIWVPLIINYTGTPLHGKRRKKMDPLEQMIKQNEAKMNLMWTTKQLPLTAQARIKLQIADIVVKAEIEHLTSEEKTDTDDNDKFILSPNSYEYLDE